MEPAVMLRPGTFSRGLLVRALVLLLLFTLFATVLVVSTTLLERMTEAVHECALAATLAQRLETIVLAERRNLLLYLDTRDPARLADNRTLRQEAAALIAALPRLISSPEEAVLVAQVQNRYARYHAQVPEEAAPTSAELQQLIDRLIRSLGDLRDINLQQMHELRARSESLNRAVDLTVYISMPLVALLLLAGAYRLWRQVVGPLLRLTDAARRLAGGNVTVQLPVGARDELGDLTSAFNTLSEALVARDTERQRALAVIAHDLRSPLTVLSGTVELLALAGPEERDRCLAVLATQCRRLTGMTHDLMESVRIETGETTVQRAPLDLAALLQETVAELRLVHRDRTFTCTAPAAITVSGDALLLQRVIVNLLSNAHKYSPRELPVTATLTVADGHAVLAISDEGSGIPPEEQAHLFQPFSRLARTAQKRPGVGLGLYAVKRLVEAHGGALRLTSAVGRGTTITVTLPLAVATSAPPA